MRREGMGRREGWRMCYEKRRKGRREGWRMCYEKRRKEWGEEHTHSCECLVLNSSLSYFALEELSTLNPFLPS